MSKVKSIFRSPTALLVFAAGMVLAAIIVRASDVNDTAAQRRMIILSEAQHDFERSLVSKYTQPYQIEVPDANTTYMRYSADDGDIFIVRITVAGTLTTFERTVDTWANRATATYIPINQ